MITVPTKNRKKAKSKIKLYSISGIPAGFPVPSTDLTQNALNIEELVVKHPAATYYVRVQGYSMINAGITTGDILVVDRSVEPKSGSIVVAVVDGEFTVKRYEISRGTQFLLPENDKYKPIEVKEGMQVEIWGVITYVIHKAE